MHELSICLALLSEVEAIARARGARCVLRIAVDVGALSGVEAPLLERAFTIARAGTIAAGARLELRTPALRVRCRRCDREWETAEHHLVCDACGDFQTELSSGDELLLRQVEME
jgi:hydrogenase nickel incorporation protein HypA/HybF